MKTRKPRKRKPGEFPCLHLKQEGWPELHMWPKLSILAEGEIVVPDFLVCAQEHGRKEWILLEVDEGGVITPESQRKEELLGLETIRVSEEHLLRMDFMDVLVEMIRGKMGLAA